MEKKNTSQVSEENYVGVKINGLQIWTLFSQLDELFFYSAGLQYISVSYWQKKTQSPHSFQWEHVLFFSFSPVLTLPFFKEELFWSQHPLGVRNHLKTPVCIPSEPTPGPDLKFAHSCQVAPFLVRSLWGAATNHTNTHTVQKTCGSPFLQILYHIATPRATPQVKPREKHNSSCSLWNNVYNWRFHFHAWLFISTVKYSLSW